MWNKLFNTNDKKEDDFKDFDFGNEFSFDDEPATPVGENVIKRQNTINEKEVERRAMAQAEVVKSNTVIEQDENESISSEEYDHDLDLGEGEGEDEDEDEEIDFDVAIQEYGITVQEIRDLKSAPGFISFLVEKEKLFDLIEGIAYRALHETKKQEDRVAFLAIIQDMISKADIKDKELKVVFMGIINGYIGQLICGRTIWWIKTF
ncbi:hypothetical protein ACI77J_01215 [Pseudomonas sp. O64]|uniref:hypothetical protein n=1 Tax=unclassified Pseudomonas TaxID=196821 RepID=UPI00387A8EE9